VRELADDLPQLLPVLAPVMPEAATRAQELLLRTDWMDDQRLAAPSRQVARDLLEALDQLAAERAARIAIQADRDRCLRILERQAGKAAT
jgi:hypothetical protein